MNITSITTDPIGNGGRSKYLHIHIPGKDHRLNESYVWWVICLGTIQQLREAVLGVSIPQHPRGVEDRSCRKHRDNQMSSSLVNEQPKCSQGRSDGPAGKLLARASYLARRICESETRSHIFHALVNALIDGIQTSECAQAYVQANQKRQSAIHELFSSSTPTSLRTLWLYAVTHIGRSAAPVGPPGTEKREPEVGLLAS